MENQTLVHADIFFFVSAIGFSAVTLLACIGLVYLIGILRNVKRMTEKIESGLDTAGDEALRFIEDVRESKVFQWMFGKSKNKNKK